MDDFGIRKGKSLDDVVQPACSPLHRIDEDKTKVFADYRGDDTRKAGTRTDVDDLRFKRDEVKDCRGIEDVSSP